MTEAQMMTYDFFVDDVKFQSSDAELPGIKIKSISGVYWPQTLYLEEPGSTPDRQIHDADTVNLSERVCRFFSVPTNITGG